MVRQRFVAQGHLDTFTFSPVFVVLKREYNGLLQDLFEKVYTYKRHFFCV